MYLRQIWEQIMGGFGIGPHHSLSAFKALIGAYYSPGRYYHTLRHIEDVLETVATLQDRATNLPAIQLAAFYHDCVYDTHASDNEERSANYTVNMLHRLGIPLDTIEPARQLILCTKTHQIAVGVDEQDCYILLDSDLAILGAHRERYHEYAEQIRKEYEWVSEEDYRRRRKQVLQSFLQRARIYRTNEIFHQLEARARRNIQDEIDTL